LAIRIFVNMRSRKQAPRIEPAAQTPDATDRF
jgi:hypothetical protein